ncbi:condensation domain-containing protein [Catenulispora subtropica]|uniref:Condensation domain-containing protein n=1 Tax=Catenulispora subtropica TaxID=450798 RepID=A0ABP5EJC6_9ACTN
MTLSDTARPAAAAVRHPLSPQQEFLRLFDAGDQTGPFGPRYIIVDGWRIRGPVDPGVLRAALADVVARHESLRTTVVRDAERPGQLVAAPTAPNLVVRMLPGVDPADRDRRAEELLNQLEAGTFAASQSPLLRAVLGRFDEDDAVLALTTHHTAGDAWSMQVIVADLAECYAARAAGRVPELEPVPQYRDYAVAERERGPLPATLDYWRRTLDGARILTVPVDTSLDPAAPPRTSWYRFVVEPRLRTAVLGLAEQTRSTPFMVLLAAFSLLRAGRDGLGDVTVPTFTPGRRDGRFQRTVGSFFNFVPVRTDLAGCTSFREAILRTRAACLGAYRHETPFIHVLGQAPALMAPAAPGGGAAPCLFQVIQPPYVMEAERHGDLEYSAIWRRVVSQPEGSDIPDGMLWSLHVGPSDDIVGAIGYSSHLFTRSAVAAAAAEYISALKGFTTRPDEAPAVA